MTDDVNPADLPPERVSLGEGTVLLQREGGVATITLNRPDQLNALDHDMWQGLLAAFHAVSDEPSDRCVVLRAEGRAFCAGQDLADSAAGRGAAGVGRTTLEDMRTVGEICLALHAIPKPVVARVHGIAAGAGCNLALGADLIVAGTSARFSQIFVRRGLAIDFGGSWVLPRLIGLHRAKELALLGDIIDADEALRIGLVNRVVADDELDATVAELAGRLAAGPPIAMALTKQLLDQGAGSSLSQAVDAEGVAQSVTSASEDVREAMIAFLKKREPVFRGR